MKKILFIAPSPFFEIRGTPIANRDMLNILSREYIVDFLSYPIGSNLEIRNINFYRSFGFGIKKINIGFSVKKIILDLGLFYKTVLMLFAHKYDYIHANEEAAFWCAPLSSLFRIPLVYDMDSIISEQIKASGKRLLAFTVGLFEKSAIRRSRLILAISENFEKYCKGANPEVIFQAIWDVPQVSTVSELEDRFSALIDKDKKRVLYIGNDAPYQGVSVIREIAPVMQDFQFILAGVGVDSVKGNLVSISKVPMEQVGRLMENCDVLVAPRISGTNPPMKIYTYMSSAKPIVASDIPAHEIIRDCSFLVKDKESYPSAIRLAVSERGGKVAASAKIKVEKMFSLFRLTDCVLSKYRGL